MKVVVPMAGRGSRFANSLYSRPKPMIDVMGRPMFSWALESICDVNYSELIFIALKEHQVKYHISDLLAKYIKRPFRLILLDAVTEGQLCTVLAAKNHIDSDEDILIIASDTVIKGNIMRDIKTYGNQVEGIISVLNLNGEQWSFAKANTDGVVEKVAEKERISDWASTGMYYFKNGARFIKEAETLIFNDERTRGEFYIMPLYQKLIDSGEQIRISIAEDMWDMGTPEALLHFIKGKEKES